MLALDADGALSCPLIGETSARSEINRINGLKGAAARKAQAAQRRQGYVLMAVEGGSGEAIRESKPKANQEIASDTAIANSLEAKASKQAAGGQAQEGVHAQSAEVMRIGTAAAEAAGFDLARWKGSFGVVAEWLKAGATETTILETIRAKARPDVLSLRYFTQAILEAQSRGGVVARTQAGAAFDAALAAWESNGRIGNIPRLADFQQVAA